MDFGLRRAGRARTTTSPQTPAQETQERQVVKRRARLQMALVGACAFGVFFGVRLSHNGKQTPALTEQAMQGTWELQSVNQLPIGPGKQSTVLSQRVRFEGGKLHGETVLRADTDAATTKMPFPDESVTTVEASADGHEVHVLWDGTYQMQQNQQVALHVGKAIYFVKAAWFPEKQSMELNQDAVLTFKGPALYRRALPLK